MAELILDANSIDNLDDFELTGELPEPSEPTQESEEPKQDPDLESEPQVQEPTQEPTQEPSAQDDLTTQILKLKGIEDPTKIKFQDDFGTITERDWKDLSDTEKLNIIANNEDPERDLDKEEILLINNLRENNLTPQQYIQAIQQLAVQQAMEKYQASQEPTYEIDSLSDDELFALDLLEKVGEENITDEELQEALEQAKSNEALFAKQIEGLRATYKNLEDQQKYNAEQSRIEQAESQYQEFAGRVLDEIGSFNSFANQEVELSTDDKNDLANYLLTRRDSGLSDFYSDIQDPNTATLAAFWLLKGPSILNEMGSQIQAAYQAGIAKGKTQVPPPAPAPKPAQVVVQTPAPSNKPEILSAFSLGDDSYLN